MGKWCRLSLLCLWPGLPQICAGKEWQGLLLAVAAGVLLNVAVVAGWIWTEWIPPRQVSALWIAVIVAWSGAATYAVWAWRGSGGRPLACRVDEVYRSALEHYLRRDWAQTDRCLRRLLYENPLDSDVLMQLAALERRRGRPEQAGRTLRRCRRVDSQRKWHWEIAQELHQLHQA
ncbi:MAG: hypothetical protein HY000_19170 [Planctomycetes bacterium]|nr:hypothetical protein [Planctomycetota bacterium]